MQYREDEIDRDIQRDIIMGHCVYYARLWAKEKEREPVNQERVDRIGNILLELTRLKESYLE